jgi:GNAT superfamily N-acetyltransferase
VAGRLPSGVKRRLGPWMVAEKVYPDFVGIGAQKAGTTWLGHNLQLHPEIWMPRMKELHYFNEIVNDPKNPVSRLYGKLTGEGTVNRRWRRQVKGRLRHHRKRFSGDHRKPFSREDFFWDLRYYAGTPDDGWYASLFKAGRGKVKGEITPAYSTLGPDSIARVHDLLPEAKLIFMMRNPIERAWSQLVMRLDKRGRKNIDPSRYRRLQKSFEREGYQARTDYLNTLENWSEFYPEERIFVGFLEDIHYYPEQLLGSVYEFLGVDPSFRPRGIGEKVHARSAGRMLAESAVYLARAYRQDVSALEKHFGGYASFWHYCAERLASNPPEEQFLPYPLWESMIWDEWTEGGARRPVYQSGPLPAVRLS